MIGETLKSIDKGAYYAFSELVNGATGQPPALVQLLDAGRWVGSIYGALLLLTLACILLLAQARLRAALVVVAAFIVGALAVEAVRFAFPVPRPDNAARTLASADMLDSFPAREVFIFTLAGALVIYAAWGRLHGWRPRLAVAATVIVLMLWVAMSEIMLVLHFVTDVAAGLCGGLALALLVTRILASSPRPTAGDVRRRTCGLGGSLG